MAYAMTKQGSLDNCITYEFICDTIADMNAIENRYRTLGSIAVVLSGESEGLEVYIAGSNKAWNNLGSMGAGSGDSSAAGLSIYICTQGEYDTNTKVPTVEDPDETSLYLVPASQESGNLYDEYVYVNNAWEKFGGGRIDISTKADKTDTVLNTTLSRGRKTNTTVGTSSFAFGNDVEASGPYTHAEGYYVQAQGIRASHAEGGYTYVAGEAAHAEGYGARATGNGAHAEGYGADSGIISNNITRNGPSAIGQGAHAEGYGDAAGAPQAVGKGAHAEGYKTQAVQQYTHAEGEGSLAAGQAAHAEGVNTKATNNASHAEGVGDDYSNNGQTFSPGSFGIASHAEGYQTISASQGSHAEGYRTQAAANYAHSEGNSTTASGGSAHAEGEYTKALSLGAHAEGYNTTANAIYAHAEGYGSSAIRDGAHAEGSYTHADGTYSHAEGTNSIAKGHSAHAEGYATIASAAYSHVVGCYNIEDNLASWPEWEPSVEYNIGDKVKRAVIIDSATVIVGYSCRTAHTSATFIQSNWNIVTQKEYVEIVGNGTANNARSNARALDWEGNERLKGDIYVGCNADSTGGTKLPRIPEAPSTDGSYILQTTVTNGTPTYTWVSLSSLSGVTF